MPDLSEIIKDPKLAERIRRVFGKAEYLVVAIGGLAKTDQGGEAISTKTNIENSIFSKVGHMPSSKSSVMNCLSQVERLKEFQKQSSIVQGVESMDTLMRALNESLSEAEVFLEERRKAIFEMVEKQGNDLNAETQKGLDQLRLGESIYSSSMPFQMAREILGWRSALRGEMNERTGILNEKIKALDEANETLEAEIEALKSNSQYRAIQEVDNEIATLQKEIMHSTADHEVSKLKEDLKREGLSKEEKIDMEMKLSEAEKINEEKNGENLERIKDLRDQKEKLMDEAYYKEQKKLNELFQEKASNKEERKKRERDLGDLKKLMKELDQNYGRLQKAYKDYTVLKQDSNAKASQIKKAKAQLNECLCNVGVRSILMAFDSTDMLTEQVRTLWKDKTKNVTLRLAAQYGYPSGIKESDFLRANEKDARMLSEVHQAQGEIERAKEDKRIEIEAAYETVRDRLVEHKFLKESEVLDQGRAKIIFLRAQTGKTGEEKEILELYDKAEHLREDYRKLKALEEVHKRWVKKMGDAQDAFIHAENKAAQSKNKSAFREAVKVYLSYEGREQYFDPIKVLEIGRRIEEMKADPEAVDDFNRRKFEEIEEIYEAFDKAMNAYMRLPLPKEGNKVALAPQYQVMQDRLIEAAVALSKQSDRLARIAEGQTEVSKQRFGLFKSSSQSKSISRSSTTLTETSISNRGEGVPFPPPKTIMKSKSDISQGPSSKKAPKTPRRSLPGA